MNIEQLEEGKRLHLEIEGLEKHIVSLKDPEKKFCEIKFANTSGHSGFNVYQQLYSIETLRDNFILTAEAQLKALKEKFEKL